MDFGDALRHVKMGKQVARDGWTKGVFIYLNEGSVDHTKPDDGHISGIRSDLFHKGDTGTVTRLPNINLRDKHGSTVTGYSTTQADLLAEDWGIVTVEAQQEAA